MVGGVVGGLLTLAGALAGLTSPDMAWPVAITCALVTVTVTNAKSALATMIDNRSATLRNRLESLRREVGDIHGLVRLPGYVQDLPLPFGGGWALTGDSAAILVREAVLRRPMAILELGSGVSTLLLGQVLKRRGAGRVLSIDHDPQWAERTRQQVQLLGLQDFVSVIVAPLKPKALGGESYDWYEIPDASLYDLGPIDLLLVDGPPQPRTSAKAARFPALPLLRQRLSHDAIVFVDDARRHTERAMIERWQADEPGWNAEWFDTVDGVCLLRRAGKPM